MPFCGGLSVGSAEPVDNVGFVLFIFIFLFINGQQWFNKIIPILGPERAQLPRKRWEVDFIKMKHLKVETTFYPIPLS